MGGAKQFEIELMYEEMSELNELMEMNLEELVSDLQEELKDAIADFDEDAANDLKKQLMNLKELLERKNYLQETYPAKTDDYEDDIEHNDYEDADEDEAKVETKDDNKDLKW